MQVLIHSEQSPGQGTVLRDPKTVKHLKIPGAWLEFDYYLKDKDKKKKKQ